MPTGHPITLVTEEDIGRLDSVELVKVTHQLLLCEARRLGIERPNIYSTTRITVADGVIGAAWADENKTDSEQRQISDYLLSEFFVPLLMVFELLGKNAPTSEKVNGLAGAIAVLMTEGFGLGWPEGIDPTLLQHQRARFYEWIANRIIEPISEVEPDLARVLAKTEIDSLTSMLGEEKHDKISLRVIIARMIHDLPDILRREINLPPALCRELGISKGIIQASISGIPYLAHDIWIAIFKAALSCNSTVIGLNRDDQIEFSRFPKWSPTRRLFVKGSGCPNGGSFTHPALPVAVLNETGIQKFLSRRVDWFDLPSDRRAERIRKICKEPDPAKRIESLFKDQEDSLEWLYSTIASKFRSHKNLSADDLIPTSLDSLYNHLRLTPNEAATGQFDLNECAARLIADIGLARAAQRFVHLPVALPEALMSAIDLAPDRVRSLVFSRLLRTTKHPLALIQTSHLLAAQGSRNPAWSDKAAQLVRFALGSEKGRDCWALYERILNWSFTVLGSHGRFRDVHARMHLLFTWLHAGRLFDVFMSGRLPLEANGEVFVAHGRSYGIDIGAWNPDFWNDCAHPRFAQRVPVLMGALGSVVSQLPPDLGALLQCDVIYGLIGDADLDNSVGFLLRDTSLMTNLLCSFLGGDCPSTFRDAMTPGFVKRLDAQDPRKLLPMLVEKLEQVPGDLQTWHILGIVLGDLPVPIEVESRVRTLISADEFTQLLDSDSVESAALLRFAASRLRLCEDKELDAAFETIVSHRLEIAAAKSGGNSIRFDVTHLASCYMGMAVVPGNEQETYTKFFAYLANMVQVCPASAMIFGPPQWSWPNKWPMSRQTGYWRFELTRRAVV